jgi:isocitrate dehydrogenase (NAD+)
MTGSMMIDWLREQEAAKIEIAVIAILKEGKVRTAGLDGKTTTSEMTDAIVAQLKN